MRDKIIAAAQVTILLVVLAAVAPKPGQRKKPDAAPPPQAAVPAPAPVVAAAPEAAPAPAAPVAPAPAPLAVPAKQLWGVIDAVDPGAHSLSVKDKRGRVYTLNVLSRAAVTIGGENKPAALTDLKTGDNVTVTHEAGAVKEIHVRIVLTRSGKFERDEQPPV